MHLVPLKVKIGINAVGHHDYPNFNRLASVQDSGLDWSKYVDVMGLSWHYDKCCGHRTQTPESPFGQQFGMLLVPVAFVDEAIVMFSDQVSRITEVEAETFYNDHAHAHEPDEIIDNDVLTGIKLKQDLGIVLTTQQQDALNPDNATPGIRKNKRKVWIDFKSEVDLTIEEVV